MDASLSQLGCKGDIDVPQFEDIVRGISSSVLGLSRVNIPFPFPFPFLFLFFCSAHSLPLHKFFQFLPAWWSCSMQTSGLVSASTALPHNCGSTFSSLFI